MFYDLMDFGLFSVIFVILPDLGLYSGIFGYFGAILSGRDLNGF